MGLKYRCKYTSVSGVNYTINISDNTTFVYGVTDIIGDAVYGMNPIEDLLHPIRSKYLKLRLLATEDEDLNELLSADEREWKVELYKETDKIFFGYLSSEGATQSFKSAERYIDFDVLDPLAFLEDLAYVQSNGTKYTGNRQIIQTIAGAVSRGFEDSDDRFPFLTYCNYDYYSYPSGVLTLHDLGDLLKYTTIPQDNYIDYDSEEAISCLDVLTRLLSALSLFIVQKDGSTWVIGHTMYDNTTMDAKYINSYDADGNDASDISLSINTQTSIEQQTESNSSTSIIHANENQSYYYKRGVQKVWYDYIFRYKRALTDNYTLDGAVTGVSMPDWTYDSDWASPNSGGYFTITKADTLGNSGSLAIISDTDTIFDSNDAIKVKGSFECNFAKEGLYDPFLDISVKFTEEGTGDIYYLDNTSLFGLNWFKTTDIDSVNMPRIYTQEDEVTEFEIILPQLNRIGTYNVLIVNIDSFFESGAEAKIYNFGIFGVDTERIGITSSQKVSNKSFKSDRKEVFYGVSRSGTKTNSFFKLTLNDPISGLNNNFVANINFTSTTSLKTLIELIQKRRRIIFSGDFFNFYEPSDIISISDVSSKKFIPIEYEFDTYNNIGTAKYEELHNDFIIHDTTTEYIYSETVKPTIE